MSEPELRVWTSFLRAQHVVLTALDRELQREHGFIFVSDDRLTAAVNVSIVDEENFLVAIDTAEEAAEDERGADYRAVIAEFDPTGEAVRGQEDDD